MMDVLFPPVHRSQSTHSFVAARTGINQSINHNQIHMDLELMQEKYKRLLESHHRLLRVNQSLEDKLLRVVTICEDHKTVMKSEIEKLTEELEFFRSKSERLEEENKKYKEDCLLAIQLLKCNPTGYNEQNLYDLPGHVRHKVVAASTGLVIKRSDSSDSTANQKNGIHSDTDEGAETPEVQIFQSFFPPNAVMVPTRRNNRNGRYSQISSQKQSPKVFPQNVSASTVADILQRDLNFPQDCDIRARPSSSSVKERSTVGKVFDI